MFGSGRSNKKANCGLRRRRKFRRLLGSEKEERGVGKVREEALGSGEEMFLKPGGERIEGRGFDLGEGGKACWRPRGVAKPKDFECGLSPHGRPRFTRTWEAPNLLVSGRDRTGEGERGK